MNNDINDIDIADEAEACFDIADARFIAYNAGWTDTATPYGVRHEDGRRGRFVTTVAGDWFVSTR